MSILKRISLLLSFLIISCSNKPSIAAEKPKHSIDPKTVVAIPVSLDPAKLNVVYEEGEYIKWINAEGETNISRVQANYHPKPVKKDEYSNCEVKRGKQNVYEDSDTGSRLVDTVTDADLVKVLGEYKYFSRIRTPRRIEGWIERSQIKDYSYSSKPFAQYANYSNYYDPNQKAYITFDPKGQQAAVIPLKFDQKKTISSAEEILKIEGALVYNDLISELAKKGIGSDSIKNYGKLGSTEFVGESKKTSFFRSHMYFGAGGVFDKQYSTIVAPDGRHILNCEGAFSPDVTIIDGNLYIAGTRSFNDSNDENARSIYGKVEETLVYKNDKVIFRYREAAGASSTSTPMGSNYVFVIHQYNYETNQRTIDADEVFDPIRGEYIVNNNPAEYNGGIQVKNNFIIKYKYDKKAAKYLGEIKLYDIGKREYIEK